jgi:hypothetical protein
VPGAQWDGLSLPATGGGEDRGRALLRDLRPGAGGLLRRRRTHGGPPKFLRRRATRRAVGSDAEFSTTSRDSRTWRRRGLKQVTQTVQQGTPRKLSWRQKADAEGSRFTLTQIRSRIDTCLNTPEHVTLMFRHASDVRLLAQRVAFIGRVAHGCSRRNKGGSMPSKPAQDIWYELWEGAGSGGLNTWYILKGMDFVRNSDHPSYTYARDHSGPPWK